MRYPLSNFVSYDSLSLIHKSFVLSISSVPILQYWNKVLNDPKCEGAMVKEMKVLKKKLRLRELVTLPSEKKFISYKWVFTIKHKTDSSIKRYKARLVAKDFTQTYGAVNYQETFAPAAKMNTIHILLSCADNLDWELATV